MKKFVNFAKFNFFSNLIFFSNSHFSQNLFFPKFTFSPDSIFFSIFLSFPQFFTSCMALNFRAKTRIPTFDFYRNFWWIFTIFKQCGLLSSLSNVWVFLDEAKSRLWLSNTHAMFVEEDLHYRRIGLSTCGSPLRQPLKMRRRPPGNPCCKFPSFQKPSLQ